jgi:hypothetical protein
VSSIRARSVPETGIGSALIARWEARTKDPGLRPSPLIPLEWPAGVRCALSCRSSARPRRCCSWQPNVR